MLATGVDAATTLPAMEALQAASRQAISGSFTLLKTDCISAKNTKFLIEAKEIVISL